MQPVSPWISAGLMVGIVTVARGRSRGLGDRGFGGVLVWRGLVICRPDPILLPLMGFVRPSVGLSLQFRTPLLRQGRVR